MPQSPVVEPVANLVSDDELASMAIPSPTGMGIAQLLHPPATTGSINQWNNQNDPASTTAFQAPYVRDDVVAMPPTPTTRETPTGVVQNRRSLGVGRKNPRSFSERRLHVPASWNPDRATVVPKETMVPSSVISTNLNPAKQDMCDSTNSVSSSNSMDFPHHNRIIHHPHQQHHPVPPPSNKAALTIEVAPGHYLPLRGAVETTHAIQTDFFRVFECWGCNPDHHHEPVFVIQDANHAICPRCDTVTPIDHGGPEDGYGHGVGLGFTFETLKDVRRGVY